MESESVDWLPPASGRIVGGVSIVLAAVILCLELADGLQGHDVPVAGGLLSVITLVWAYLLRPRVGLAESALVLRHPWSTRRLPLAAVEQVALRQVFVVSVAGKRYVSTGLGRSRREIRKADQGRQKQRTESTEVLATFLEDRISAAMEAARDRAGVGMLSAEQEALAAGVRREWAWPEIVVGLVALSAFVGGLLT